MHKLSVLVLNEFDNDSRVKKEAMSLSLHYNVEVMALGKKNLFDCSSDDYGFNVVRVADYNRTSNGVRKKISQILCYIKYFFLTLFALRHSRFVHCNDLNTLPIGVLSRLIFRKVKVVYDAHEYETETIWMKNPFKKKLAKLVEAFLLRFVDGVIVVSDSISEAYSSDYKLPLPVVIKNCPPYSQQLEEDLFRKEFPIEKQSKIFLYQGGLTLGRGVETLLEAFSEPELKDATLIFLGYGYLEDKIKEYASKHSNIYFHDAVLPEVLLNYTASADVGLSLIEDKCLNYRFCLPNKIFEYVQAGLPIIVSDLVEQKKFVDQNGFGFAVDVTNKQSIIEAVLHLTSLDLSELKNKVVNSKEFYCWENESKKLLSLYEQLN